MAFHFKITILQGTLRHRDCRKCWKGLDIEWYGNCVNTAHKFEREMRLNKCCSSLIFFFYFLAFPFFVQFQFSRENERVHFNKHWSSWYPGLKSRLETLLPSLKWHSTSWPDAQGHDYQRRWRLQHLFQRNQCQKACFTHAFVDLEPTITDEVRTGAYLLSK